MEEASLFKLSISLHKQFNFPRPLSNENTAKPKKMVRKRKDLVWKTLWSAVDFGLVSIRELKDGRPVKVAWCGDHGDAGNSAKPLAIFI